MKIILTFVLLLFAITAIKAQKSHPKPDLLLQQLKKSKPDTNRIVELIGIAKFYADTSAYDKSDTVEFYLKQAQKLNNIFHVAAYQNSINIISANSRCGAISMQAAKGIFLPLIEACKKTGDIKNEWWAWKYMADHTEGNPQSYLFRLHSYQHALTLIRKLNDRQSELDVIRNIADNYIQQHNFALAENELLSIINPAQEASHSNLLFAYDLLSSLYISKGDYNKALFYALKTERNMHTAIDSLYTVTFYSRLSNIYNDLGNASASLMWSRKAYDYVMLTEPNSSFLSVIRGPIIYSLIKLGKPREALNFVLKDNEKRKPSGESEQRAFFTQIGTCYDALKNYSLAEKSYLETVRLIRNENYKFSPIEKALSYSRIGEFYLKTGQQVNAKTYLQEALKYYEVAGDVYDIKDICLLLFKADSAAANYRSAIAYLQRSNGLKDSIFKSTKNKQIEELQIAYDTEQKQKDIKALQDKTKLQKLSLNHAESTRNWIVSGSLMLLIIAVLLFRQARLTKKNNADITIKNELLQRLLLEKEWLLKEVHHRVKNNLHTVICLLESQARYLEDDALMAIENSKHRIFAMSLIHQKLYRSDDIKAIDMAEYITELVHNLKTSFGVIDDIIFRLNLDPITLNITHAIPLGLIINEAVTNSIKYAFPGKTGNEISISLHDDGKEIKLEMADNGVGITNDPCCTEYQSLGIELMKGLSGDINATIRFEVNEGTRVIINFCSATIGDEK